MLDAATMALLAKLKVLGKQSGTNIDLVKMSDDKKYAEHTLNELSNADDPELVLIVIQLMNLFGMIKAPSLQAKAEEKDDKNRYVGSLR
ncbi:hypothetical protein [Sideroxydans lithotrophicus]|uniref:Uncharacterized protein n=1 Tax=Sideroxydans lithotrophicus (strain ES-1) TaxID=580332 RepID=D5CPW2_SIDLE|nr:hypothetical protein [Sideroxydans lithotrophicus]ADE11126.1 conserved hypothetical protein [Sideroxydans lithotrophicus ES-1]